MNKNKKIIASIIIFSVICIFTCVTFKYLYDTNKLSIEKSDKKDEVKEKIEKEEQDNNNIISEESNLKVNEDLENNNDSIELNTSSDNIGIDNTDVINNSSSVIVPTNKPKPSVTPKPSPTPIPTPIPTNKPEVNKENDNLNQNEQPIQQETTKEETNLDIAIRYHLEAGDPITYNEQGKILTVEECMSLGELLKNRQETSFVYQFECPFTEYKGAIAVGLNVCFEYNGLQQCSSYDEYKKIIK